MAQQQEWPEVMDTVVAQEFLTAELNGAAPTLGTLRNWGKPSWRRKNRSVVRSMKLPNCTRFRGRRKLVWSKERLKAWADYVRERAAPRAAKRRGE